MDIERLRKIIAFSEKNREEIDSKVKRFCAFAGVGRDDGLLSILQIARSSFQKRNVLVIELPFADVEIGALCCRGDGLGYVVINTALPRAGVNFAVAHEIYHVFFQGDGFTPRAGFSDDHYYEHEEEYAANLFAGMLLMPEAGFRKMYGKFREDSSENEADTLIRLMSYYRVPYMAVLVRCLELRLLPEDALPGLLLKTDRDWIKSRLAELWLDESIMEPSGIDDFPRVERIVEKLGREYVSEGYIHERALEKALRNMRGLYEKLKG